MKNIFFVLLFILCNVNACQKWSYLKSAAFKKARQERVAQMVAACDMIVEIGGAGVPMSGFVAKDKKVIVIDPEIRRKEEINITHVPKPFEKWDEQPMSKNYAVVILGLQLKMPDGAWKKLHALIEGSALTIIEYSVQNKKARKQFKDIQKSVSKDWKDPIKFKINGYELAQYKTQILTHRVIHCTAKAGIKS